MSDAYMHRKSRACQGVQSEVEGGGRKAMVPCNVMCSGILYGIMGAVPGADAQVVLHAGPPDDSALYQCGSFFTIWYGLHRRSGLRFRGSDYLGGGPYCIDGWKRVAVGSCDGSVCQPAVPAPKLRSLPPLHSGRRFGRMA